MTTRSCGEGTFAFANSCILKNETINKYITDVLLPDVYVPSKQITENEFKFYKPLINIKYGTYKTFQEFDDNFFASQFPVENTSNKDNYVVSMWKKMLTICDVINEDYIEEPVIKPASSKEDIVIQLIKCKVYASRKKISRKTRALVTKINEIMELLLKNMYDVLAFDGSNNDGITQDGFDVFTEYGLEMFVPKPKFLKDKFANIHIMKRKELSNGSKVQYSQQPYGEIKSFKLKKDVNTNPLFQGIPSKNVRVGNTDLGNTGYIASKSMWYKLKKIDTILMNVQHMFDIVKTFYANATIDFSLRLNEVYPLPVEFADVYGEEIDDLVLLKYVEEQLTMLKDKKYAPTSARLYGLVSGFMESVANEVVNQTTIDIFVKDVDNTLNMFNTVQLGGGIGNALKSGKENAINLGISVYENAKKLSLLSALKVSESIRDLLNMPAALSCLLSLGVAVLKCGDLARKAVFNMFSSLAVDTIKCGIGLYVFVLSVIAQFKPETLSSHVQWQVSRIIGTTDLFCLIVQYGMFKPMHEVLLEYLKEIAESDTIIESRMTAMQVELKQKFENLREQWETNSLNIQNVFVLHGKIEDLMYKISSTSSTTKEGYKYIKANTPSTKKNMLIVLKHIFGNVDDLYDYFPSNVSVTTQREMAIFFKKHFPAPDLQKFIAATLLEKFDNKNGESKYESKRYIVDYFSKASTLHNDVVQPLSENNILIQKDSVVMSLEKYMQQQLFNVTNAPKSKYYWQNIEFLFKSVVQYEVDDLSDADVLYYNYVHCALRHLMSRYKTNATTNIDNAYINIIRDLNNVFNQLNNKIAHRSFTLTEIPNNVCNEETSRYINFMRTLRGDSEIDFTKGGSRYLNASKTTKHKKK